jgi:TrmH family RNA methyltransferase
MIIMRRTVSAAAPAHRPIKRAAMMATSAAAAANADAAANAANATATPSIGSDLYAAQQTSSVWRTLHNPPPLLSHLRVVLVQPKSPENIGAACRALANFECPDLVVVAPRTALDPREDGRVAAVACGEAVRSGMRVVDTLEEALSDCAGSVGLTRRGGATRVTHESLDALEAAFPGTVLPPQSAADAAASPPIALVFGREESGLTESELRLCSHACAIPTGRVHSSMNLSAAVAVTLAWLFARRAGVAEAAAAVAASGGEGKDREQPSVASASVAANPGLERSAAGDPNQQQGFRPASAAELEALLDKAAALALAAGESPDESSGGGNRGTHGRRRKAQGHLRAVLQRARATAWEARSLHGYLSAALKAAGVEDERAALEEARSRRRAWQQEQRRDREGPAGGGGGGGGGDDQQQQ